VEQQPEFYLDVFGAAGSNFYTAGTMVVLEAERPDDTYVFDYWGGDTQGIKDINSGVIEVVMNSERSLVANFRLLEELIADERVEPVMDDMALPLNASSGGGSGCTILADGRTDSTFLILVIVALISVRRRSRRGN